MKKETSTIVKETFAISITDKVYTENYLNLNYLLQESFAGAIKEKEENMAKVTEATILKIKEDNAYAYMTEYTQTFAISKPVYLLRKQVDGGEGENAITTWWCECSIDITISASWNEKDSQ